MGIEDTGRSWGFTRPIDKRPQIGDQVSASTGGRVITGEVYEVEPDPNAPAERVLVHAWITGVK